MLVEACAACAVARGRGVGGRQTGLECIGLEPLELDVAEGGDKAPGALRVCWGVVGEEALRGCQLDEVGEGGGAEQPSALAILGGYEKRLVCQLWRQGLPWVKGGDQ